MGTAINERPQRSAISGDDAIGARRGGWQSSPISRCHYCIEHRGRRLFAASKGLDPQQPNHAASKIEVLARITSLLVALSRYAQVRAVHLALEPWTVDAGLLTPTLQA